MDRPDALPWRISPLIYYITKKLLSKSSYRLNTFKGINIIIKLQYIPIVNKGDLAFMNNILTFGGQKKIDTF